jgi:hypothetical protein
MAKSTNTFSCVLPQRPFVRCASRPFTSFGIRSWSGSSAINASKEKPEIFGLSLAPAAIIEGFAVFAFVFALVVSADIPAGGGS